MHYNKLYSSLIGSSLWTEQDRTRILFITMLAMADRDGMVYGTQLGLERIANIAPTDGDSLGDPDEDPMAALMLPDSGSSDLLRNPDNEGRRVEKVEGGYRLINFEYYSSLMASDTRREQNRQAQRAYRHKNADSKKIVSKRQQPSAAVSDRKPSEAEAEVEAKKNKPPNPLKRGNRSELVSFCQSIGLPEADGEYFFDHWEGNGWRNGGKAIQNWQATIRSWKAAGHCPSQKPIKNGEKPWVSAKDREQAERDASNRAYRDKKAMAKDEIPRQEPAGFREWLVGNYSNAVRVPYADMETGIVREYLNRVTP